MLILSHRGYWQLPEEQNTLSAFERSFTLGFGTELDIRDHAGTLVVAHDMPSGNEITFEELVQCLNGRALPLAINIKADGLYSPLQTILQKYQHTNYFTFDMSIPEQRRYIDTALCVFTGLSDIVPQPILYEQSDGIWLDAFFSDWYTTDTIDTLLSQNKKVCIVSAELHKRDPHYQWSILRQCIHVQSDSLLLCTDYPEKAQEYFQ
ncbi:MAG: hypothetical protein ACRCV3_03250 [Desulfovibrionaceae bacterium]